MWLQERVGKLFGKVRALVLRRDGIQASVDLSKPVASHASITSSWMEHTFEEEMADAAGGAGDLELDEALLQLDGNDDVIDFSDEVNLMNVDFSEDPGQLSLE
eukprot:480378-Prymnesium_polylepis.1